MKFSDINHPLGLRYLPLPYASFTKLSYESFADENTLVFLDTNILGLPFRFHSEARKGFFSLIKIALDQKRLYIPAWASNEYFHNAFKSSANGSHGFSRSAEFITKLPRQEKVLGLLGKVASDDDLEKIAGKLGVKKSDALATMAEIANNWNSAVDKIGADLDPEVIHDELTKSFSDCFLPLDYNKHNTLIDQHAERRRANRIPPGLTDVGKADLEKRGRNAGNVDGDLALWLEILDNSQKLTMPTTDLNEVPRRYSCVMILTEEKKEDFSYAPKFRNFDVTAKKTGKTPNVTPKILLTDPRLVSEFESKVKHRNISFSNIETLAHGWQGVNGGMVGGDDIRAFARALMEQMDTETSDSAISAEANQSSTTGSEPAIEEIPETDAQVPQEITQHMNDGLDIPDAAANDEKAYIEHIAALAGAEIIDSLNTHNWYVQNPAVVDLMQRGIPLDNGVSFLVGRSLFQAAHGNAWRADNYIKNLGEIAGAKSDNEQSLLAGMAYEAIFDGKGERRLEPKNRNLQHILSMLCDSEWKKARDWIVKQMEMAPTEFYWKPCEPAPEITLTIVGENHESKFNISKILLNSPGFEEINVLKKQSEHSKSESISMEDLFEWVSKNTLVPENKIKCISPIAMELEIPPGLTLDPYRIHQIRKTKN
jgi:hypothetical protein